MVNEEMKAMEDMADVLSHHGILGQKWGIRRYQNPDGTLTEAGRARLGRTNDKSSKHKDDIVFSKGKKLDHLSGKKDLKLRGKVEGDMLAVGVAGAAAGIGISAISPSAMPAGAYLTALSSLAAASAFNKRNARKLFVYDDDNDHDKDVYEGAFSQFVIEKKIAEKIQLGLDFTKVFADNNVFKHQYEAINDLISPSQERRAELFVETYRKNTKLMSKALEKIDNDVQISNLAPILKDKSGKVTYDKNISDEDLKKYGYTMFNIGNEFTEPSIEKMNSKYYKTLEKNGYNALIDDNNKDVYNGATNPLIVLNAKRNLKELSVSELTSEQRSEAEKRLKKYMKKHTGSEEYLV